MGERLVSFGGNTVKISSNTPTVINAISSHFAHCSTETCPEIAHYHIAAITERNFSLSLDGGILYSDLNLEQVLQYLAQEALTLLNGSCTMGPIFHAAALEIDRKGVILCGKSGSGKSSLAAWLMANGFRYLTDEVIIYHQDIESITGFSRSLVLKRGSAFIWQRWLGNITNNGSFSFKDGSVWIDPLLFTADNITIQTKPFLLLFPRYSPESSLRIEKLSPAEALFCLLQNLVNARNFSNYGMDTTTRLARQVKAYRLTYSDIEGATEWIKQIVLA